MKSYEITINESPNSGRQPVSVGGKMRHLPIGKKVTVTEAELEVLTHANIGISIWGEAGDVAETDLPEEPVGQEPDKDEPGVENPIEAREEEQAAEQDQQPAAPADEESHPLDRDKDGEPGGSLPDEPPALTGKTKAELIEIAKDEKADISKATNNDQRIEAIEANRKAKG